MIPTNPKEGQYSLHYPNSKSADATIKKKLTVEKLYTIASGNLSRKKNFAYLVVGTCTCNYQSGGVCNTRTVIY